MTALANPVELITGLATTADVSKADTIAWAKARVRQRVADATEVRATDFTGQFGGLYISSLQGDYNLDTADTTSLDDNFNCIRDTAGNAFKRGLPQSNLTQVGVLRSIAALGDSITSNGTYIVSGNQFCEANGYTTWMQILSRYRLRFPVENNFGVAGNSVAQMLARVGDVLAVHPDIVVVHGGTNDASGIAVSTTIAGLAAIYDTFALAGIAVIAVPILGRASPNALTTTARKHAQQVNDWIRRQGETRKGFYVADCGLAFDDPATTDWQPRSNYTQDGIHPSPLGAFQIGNAVAAIINLLVPDWRVATASATDIYDAAENPFGNLIPNGMMSGTGGTIDGAVATGVVADNWHLGDTFLGGATCVASKVTLSDGRTAQKIIVSGNSNGNNKGVQFYLDTTAANVVAGNTIEAIIDLRADSLTDICQVSAYFQTTEASVDYQQHACVGDVSNVLPASGFNGLQLTPRRLVSANPTLVRLNIFINFLNHASALPVGCTITIASAALRKVQS